MLTSRSHIPALNVIIGEIDILATSWSGESAKRKSLRKDQSREYSCLISCCPRFGLGQPRDDLIRY